MKSLETGATCTVDQSQAMAERVASPPKDQPPVDQPPTAKPPAAKLPTDQQLPGDTTPSNGNGATMTRTQAQPADNITQASAQNPPQPTTILRERLPGEKPGWFTRLGRWLEARISRLSTRNNFWHRVCSWVWLPLAYRSGISFHKGDENTFTAVLPFRRFNKNWYNAMAGGALLGNAEVAGGMYVFGRCGAKYTVVCKHLEYDFLRPCLGPAAYHITPRENLEACLATGGEFNITIDMVIVQMVSGKNKRERRVGKCTATFHVTPKAQHHRKRQRQKKSN